MTDKRFTVLDTDKIKINGQRLDRQQFRISDSGELEINTESTNDGLDGDEIVKGADGDYCRRSELDPQTGRKKWDTSPITDSLDAPTVGVDSGSRSTNDGIRRPQVKRAGELPGEDHYKLIEKGAQPDLRDVDMGELIAQENEQFFNEAKRAPNSQKKRGRKPKTNNKLRG